MTRQFEASDLAAYVELFVSTFAQPPWSDAWEPRIVHARLDQIIRTPGSFGVVILANGEVAGFALGISEPWHEGAHIYLNEMRVAHGRQRKGLGTRFLDYLFDGLRKSYTKRVYFLTARVDMSESFYAKAGFHTSPKMSLMTRRIE